MEIETPSWKTETRGSLKAVPRSEVMPRITKPGLLGDWFCTSKPGTKRDELLELVEAEVIEELAAIGGQRDRHLDRVLLAQLRGDDDVGVVLRRGCRLLLRGRCGLLGLGGQESATADRLVSASNIGLIVMILAPFSCRGRRRRRRRYCCEYVSNILQCKIIGRSGTIRGPATIRRRPAAEKTGSDRALPSSRFRGDDGKGVGNRLSNSSSLLWSLGSPSEGRLQAPKPVAVASASHAAMSLPNCSSLVRIRP